MLICINLYCFVRNHLELTANYEKDHVRVKLLSKCPCYIEEKELKIENTAELKTNMKLYIVNKDYPHFLEFENIEG